MKLGVNIHVNNEDSLKLASYHGHLEVVKYLVENGANMHINDDEPLRWAIANGHSDVVKYLSGL